MSSSRNATLQRLLALCGAEGPTTDEHGTTRVTFEWSTTSVHDVLTCLPGEHERRRELFTELFDDTGEGVDYEWEQALYACGAELSIFSFSQHFQAGMSGTVCLCVSEAAYQRELQRLLEDSADADDAEGRARGRA